MSDLVIIAKNGTLVYACCSECALVLTQRLYSEDKLVRRALHRLANKYKCSICGRDISWMINKGG